MNASGQGVQKHIERPSHPIPRKYVEPVVYLAERMSQMDRVIPASGKRMAEQLADALQLKDVRRQAWYRQLSDKKACEQIDLDTVKKGVLVVLSLILKADTGRGDEAKQYFSQVREMLGAEPVAVPAEIDAHKDLALRYLVG